MGFLSHLAPLEEKQSKLTPLSEAYVLCPPFLSPMFFAEALASMIKASFLQFSSLSSRGLTYQKSI